VEKNLLSRLSSDHKVDYKVIFLDTSFISVFSRTETASVEVSWKQFLTSI
jgi:hypothetical protein